MNALPNEIFYGFAWLPNGAQIPFHFENGFITLFCGLRMIPSERSISCIEAQDREGKSLLFHFSIPLQTEPTIPTIVVGKSEPPTSQTFLSGNITCLVDYYVMDYDSGVSFTHMGFSFAELDSFYPSTRMYKRSCKKYKFSRKAERNELFSFECSDREVSLFVDTFVVCSSRSLSKCIVETKTRLVLKFTETNDFGFFMGLYTIVHNFFSFIYNRRNISLCSATLSDSRPSPQTIVVIDKYKHESEEKTILPLFGAFSSHLKELFQLFLDDKYDIFSIHPSSSLRNYFDLGHCLSIMSAFEYYHRTFLPAISSPSTVTFYEDMKKLVQNYIDESSGRIKTKAKEFHKSIRPEISLGQRITKVYNGYEGWKSVKTILSGWFGEDVSGLADIANEWRNELAHGKREFEPNKNVITATRLVEHLNYCMVLREAGYTDDEIELIIENILSRNM